MALKSLCGLVSITKWAVRREYRLMSVVAEHVQESAVQERSGRCMKKPGLAEEYRKVYPEFLPDPNPNWRNSLREKLERMDMLKRRNQIDIPEFYVVSHARRSVEEGPFLAFNFEQNLVIVFKWKEEHIPLFLEHFKKCPCLWYKTEGYKNRDCRRNAIKLLIEDLNIGGVTEEDKIEN